MDEKKREAILDFAGTHNLNDLNKALGFDVQKEPKSVLSLLEDAARSQNADDIECALIVLSAAGIFPAAAPVLITILELPWHRKHEDAAHALQILKYPRAVDALYRAALANHDYLAYDEFGSLARKCTWALADIGTPEAFEKLQLLAKCGNSMIEGYAQKRIDAWQKETTRKGIKGS